MTLAKLSLCVLTPHASEAALTSAYMKTIRALDRALDSGAWRIDEGTTQLGIDTGLDMQIDRHVRAPADVVRTRSRLARLFLEGSSADYAVWLDDDNDCSDDITILPRMIALAHQFELGVIGAPYPKKYLNEAVLTRWMRWAIGVERRQEADEPGAYTAPELALSARVLAHPLQFAFEQDSFAWLAVKGRAPCPPPHPWLTELAGVGFGCCVTSRACLERMVLHYWESTRFHDQVMGGKTPGIFRFDRDEDENMPTEDFAFSKRWAGLGERCWGYVGPGAPIAHVGVHRFVADRQCLYATK